MPNRLAPNPIRRGSALRNTSIGCAAVLMLVVVVLALTFGYFGPGLPRQDYDLLYEQHAETQSGLDANQTERSRQIMHEIRTLLNDDIIPILVTDTFKLGGDEVNDPNLPADQIAAIDAVGVAMETSGINSRIDELISLGRWLDCLAVSSPSHGERMTPKGPHTPTYACVASPPRTRMHHPPCSAGWWPSPRTPWQRTRSTRC